MFRISKIQLDEAKYLHAGLTGEAGHLAGLAGFGLGAGVRWGVLSHPQSPVTIQL